MTRSARSFSWTLLLALATDAVVRAESDIAAAEGRVVAAPSTMSEEAAGERLDAVWVDVHGLVPFAFPGAVEEASSILERAGLHYEYRRASAGVQDGPCNVKVVLLPRSQAARPSGPLVMGAVNPSRLRTGEVRVVWVFVEPVAVALGLRSVRENPAVIGRAIGRVVAHELVHLMVPQLGHSSHGLMAAKLTAAELRAPRLDLDRTFREALRSSRLLASAPPLQAHSPAQRLEAGVASQQGEPLFDP